MGRTNEGGSILSFIVIGVVLAALLLSGVYTVRQQLTAASEAARPQETAPAPEKKEQDKKDEKQAEKTPQKEEDKKAEEQKPSTAPQPEQNKSAQLPETGPDELFASLLALGLLSAAVISYARSRRPGLHFDF